MSSVKIIAKRPPTLSLVKAFIYLNLGWLPVWGLIAIVTAEKNLLDPKEGGIFWVRVVLMALMGLLALYMGLLVLRIALRWILVNASITVGNGQVHFRIPLPLKWLSPFARIREKTIPLSDLKRFEYTTRKKSMLTIHAGGRPLEIFSGAFAASPYAIEQGLRKASRGALEAVDPDGHWEASAVVRMVMIVTGLVLIFGPWIFVALSPVGDNADAMNNLAKILAPVSIFGLALLFLSLLYRGRVVVDDRGLFFERSGIVSFISWEDMNKGKVEFKKESSYLGLWGTLTVQSPSTFSRNPDCKISLNRIAWMGFPLREIHDSFSGRLGG